MKNALAFLVITLSIVSKIFAQDARLTQYDKLPLLMSPSLIGNFDGSSRVIGYYNYATDDNLSNNVFNLTQKSHFPIQKVINLKCKYNQC
jgi:hypothetical protein